MTITALTVALPQLHMLQTAITRLCSGWPAELGAASTDEVMGASYRHRQAREDGIIWQIASALIHRWENQKPLFSAENRGF
ncbi:hypothetical protein GCM10027061_27560 [Nesterenkonia suensis]